MGWQLLVKVPGTVATMTIISGDAPKRSCQSNSPTINIKMLIAPASQNLAWVLSYDQKNRTGVLQSPYLANFYQTQTFLALRLSKNHPWLTSIFEACLIAHLPKQLKPPYS